MKVYKTRSKEIHSSKHSWIEIAKRWKCKSKSRPEKCQKETMIGGGILWYNYNGRYCITISNSFLYKTVPAKYVFTVQVSVFDAKLSIWQSLSDRQPLETHVQCQRQQYGLIETILSCQAQLDRDMYVWKLQKFEWKYLRGGWWWLVGLAQKAVNSIFQLLPPLNSVAKVVWRK